MIRKQTSVSSEVKIFRNLKTESIFTCGEYRGDSLGLAVQSAINAGDCHVMETKIILDGRNIGSLWQNGFQSSKGIK